MGKGSSGPTESTVTQNNLPEYAEPYYRDLLGRVGYESAVPYETYQGSRLQYFTPSEQEAMGRFEQLGVSGTPDELKAAGDIYAQIGTGNPYAGTMLEVTRRAQEMPHYASTFRQGNVYTGYDPVASGSTGVLSNAAYYDPVAAGSTEILSGAAGYDANSRDVKFSPGSLADSWVIDRYMDPYMQLVVDRQKEEASRQSNIMGQDISLGAAGAGSLGGYREAIMQSERQRNLEDQLGDIQAQGDSTAYAQALQAFEQDRQAKAQLEGFEQGQFDLNERYRQAALGTNINAFQAGEQARLQAYNANISAFQAGEQARQQGAQMGLTAQEIEQRGRIAEENARLAAWNARTGQANTAAQIGQAAYSQLLQGDQLRMGAAEGLAGFTDQRQAMEIERLRNMQTAGQIERELEQRGLDIGYSDFLRQQAYPKEQLSFYSSMLQGIPIAPGQVSQAYGITPSMTQQLLGAGIAGVGLYNAMG